MIKAMIVDDEKLSRETLQKLLELHCPEVEVVAACEDADAAGIKAGLLLPELVFLDVAMPGKSGIDFLKELPDIKFEVIFVTAHDKYVLQAIRLSAVDYLSKPIEEQQLVIAVENAAKRICQKAASRNLEIFLHNIHQHSHTHQEMQLCIPGLKGFQVVSVKDIIYCEAENTYTTIHFSDNRKIVASRILMDYEMLLQDSFFYRIHKSILVNMKHIKEYQKGEGGFVAMSNGQVLEVSRRRKDGFISKMKEIFKY